MCLPAEVVGRAGDESGVLTGAGSGGMGRCRAPRVCLKEPACSYFLHLALHPVQVRTESLTPPSIKVAELWGTA